jgi:hypothetical protein
MTAPNPYIVTHSDAYRGEIELAAGVSIAIQRCTDDDTNEPTGEYYAWANREDSAGRSHTVASAMAFDSVAALDRLAKQLGVFDRIGAARDAA